VASRFSKDRARKLLAALDGRSPPAEALAPQAEDLPPDSAVRCTPPVRVPADARPWEPLDCRLREPPDALQDAQAALLAAQDSATFPSTKKGQ
jgi:hypothetical protein